MATLDTRCGLRLERRAGVIQFPVHYARGGTSTGVILDAAFAPADVSAREELLRHLLGVPQRGTVARNSQITGLGRGTATSNKAFLAHVETVDGRNRIVSTLAQLAAAHATVDWSVNCGNFSSALPLWAVDMGLGSGMRGDLEIDIRNTNTGVITKARLLREGTGLRDVEIPGVQGAFPGVDLFLRAPVGAKTGTLLPTGRVVDDVIGVQVSCVDVAVPMVIIDAASFGKSAWEEPAELEADADFMRALRAVWIEAGVRMGLRKPDGELMSRDALAHSETIPKVCIVGKPRGGGAISVRYFTPQTAHASMAVSGGCCLAAAMLISGSIASRVAVGVAPPCEQDAEQVLGMENPAGVLEATVVARVASNRLEVTSVGYRRNAQILQRGHVPLYHASRHLENALSALMG